MTVAQQEDLKLLEQLLWKRLQSEVPGGNALKVGCAMSDGTLVVLSQHPPEANFDSQEIFVALQRALQLLRPQVTQSVRCYLRVAGQKQPYAKHDFILQPLELLVGDETNALTTNLEEGTTEVTDSNTTAAVHPQRYEESHEQEELEVTDSNTTAAVHPQRHEESHEQEELEVTDSNTTAAVHPTHPSASISQDEAVRENVPHRLVQPKSKPWQLPQLQIPTPVVVVGGGVALAALFSSAYAFSRPCIMGQCAPLQTAQQLNQAATHMMRWANSHSDLLTARQQLAEANNSLKLVPRWSSRYQEANQLSQNLLAQAAMLDHVTLAWQQASAATQRSQNSPHSVQEWRVIRAMWQRAIAQIASVPNNSPLFPLAQRKVSEYQANLQSVNQQLNLELEAMNLELEASKKLTQAKNTAQLASKYQGNAQSWQAWQQVKASWQAAINTLAAIPKTSKVYPEAQQLLKSYRPQLVTASDRTLKEQEAAKAFSQATSFANQAKRDEQQNQFSQAVSHWKQALTNVKQIPSGTQYYRQVPSLVNSYSTVVQQAQAKLKVAKVLQEARTDLNRTCSGKVRVCNYRANDQLILVKLTSDYERAVEHSYTTARLKGDRQTQADVAFHYQTLRQALEAISDNAGIPLQVHQADDSPLHSYEPRI